MQNTVVPNRKYKDGLFAYIFHEKNALLSLYNAINGSSYTDPDELEIYTMEGFIYMGRKNDLSFLIDSQLAVFEHQSSYNPNMPLRGYIYMADALKKYIALNHLDIYSSRLLELPTPRYYVFYNGLRQAEDEIILCLTDSMRGEDAAERSCAQFKAHMININQGHSPALMEKCPLLYEYSYFVASVRKYMKEEVSRMEAVDRAVKECIGKGILADILRAHRAEVTEMLLQEYDEEFHISCEKKISFEDGVRQEKARTDEARREAEEARQEADKARQEADKARREAEEARREADKARYETHQKIEILAQKLRGSSEEEIAAALHLPAETVRECIESALGDKT